MPFVSDPTARYIMITNVTEAEYEEFSEFVDEEMSLMNYPLLFPSRKDYNHCTMLLMAGMGCGDGRWQSEYLPMIQQRFAGRIIYAGEFS